MISYICIVHVIMYKRMRLDDVWQGPMSQCLLQVFPLTFTVNVWVNNS